MAIPGLRSAEQPSEVRVEVDPSDSVEVTMGALDMLGRIEGDRDEVKDAIATAYATTLGRVSTPGELYVLPPLGAGFTLKDMLTLADGASYPEGRTYSQTYPLNQGDSDFNNRLWFPKDPTREGYSVDEINRTDIAKDGQEAPVATVPTARIALKNGSESQDPMLQLLGLPYDEMYAGEGEPTQLTELAKAQAEFAADEANEGLELTPINAAGFVMLALQARIKGEQLPSSWGFMRIPQLGRKTVDGDSVVGYVRSRGGQLRFSYSYGDGYGGDGVGFSVGQIET